MAWYGGYDGRRGRPGAGLGRARGRPRAARHRLVRGAPCRRVDRLSPAAPDAQRQAPAVAGAARPPSPAASPRSTTLIGTAIASGKDGAVSVAQPMPTASTSCRSASSASPSASCCCRNWRARCAPGNRKEAANLQNRSVEFTLFLTLPAAAALLVMSEPIVRVLYERGAFTARTTRRSSPQSSPSSASACRPSC